MDRGAIQKKQLIIEKAAEVFAEKGFLKVTMKDIVEACGISRGDCIGITAAQHRSFWKRQSRK